MKKITTVLSLFIIIFGCNNNSTEQVNYDISTWEEIPLYEYWSIKMPKETKISSNENGHILLIPKKMNEVYYTVFEGNISKHFLTVGVNEKTIFFDTIGDIRKIIVEKDKNTILCFISDVNDTSSLFENSPLMVLTVEASFSDTLYRSQIIQSLLTVKQTSEMEQIGIVKL